MARGKENKMRDEEYPDTDCQLGSGDIKEAKHPGIESEGIHPSHAINKNK